MITSATADCLIVTIKHHITFTFTFGSKIKILPVKNEF